MVGRGVDPYGTGGHIPHIFFQKEGGVSFGKLWRTNTCYRTKCQQNQPNGFEISKFFDFQEAAVRHLGFLKV